VIRVSLILGSESAPKIGKRGAEDLGVARTAPLRFPYLIAYWPWAFYDPLWKAREFPWPVSSAAGGDPGRRRCRLLPPDGARRERHAGAPSRASQGRLELEAAASPGSLFARVPTLNCPRQRAMRKLYSQAMINAEAIE